MSYSFRCKHSNTNQINASYEKRNSYYINRNVGGYDYGVNPGNISASHCPVAKKVTSGGYCWTIYEEINNAGTISSSGSSYIRTGRNILG